MNTLITKITDVDFFKEGQKEDIEINQYLQTINNNYKVQYHRNTNNKQAPYIIDIKK